VKCQSCDSIGTRTLVFDDKRICEKCFRCIPLKIRNNYQSRLNAMEMSKISFDSAVNERERRFCSEHLMLVQHLLTLQSLPIELIHFVIKFFRCGWCKKKFPCNKYSKDYCLLDYQRLSKRNCHSCAQLIWPPTLPIISIPRDHSDCYYFHREHFICFCCGLFLGNGQGFHFSSDGSLECDLCIRKLD